MFRNGLKIDFGRVVDFIIWISILAILIVFSITVGRCAEKDSVDVYHKNKLQFSMTYAEFNAILKSADVYSKILDAENNSRVVVELADDVWVIGKTEFITNAKISWLDDKGKSIKTVTIKIKINTDGTGKFKIQNYYNEASKYGFPIMVILFIIAVW